MHFVIDDTIIPFDFVESIHLERGRYFLYLKKAPPLHVGPAKLVHDVTTPNANANLVVVNIEHCSTETDDEYRVFEYPIVAWNTEAGVAVPVLPEVAGEPHTFGHDHGILDKSTGIVIAFGGAHVTYDEYKALAVNKTNKARLPPMQAVTL